MIEKMASVICCTNERRRLHKKDGKLNGIDYLEVYHLVNERDNKKYCKFFLFLFFFQKPPQLETNDLKIIGVLRRNFEDVGIEKILRANDLAGENNSTHGTSTDTSHDSIIAKVLDLVNALNKDEKERLLILFPYKMGDFSKYILRLDLEQTIFYDEKKLEIDPLFSEVEFTLRSDCNSKLEIDCIEDNSCKTEKKIVPQIDYLAKDYASFRQLMLDRMSVTNPDWQQKSPADLGIMLVELLSYVGDHLSYYQDAVATEAYLGTARRRISVDRHLRLLGQRLNNGQSSRTWICLELVRGAPSVTIPTKSILLTNDSTDEVLVTKDKFELTINSGAQPFETLYDTVISEPKNKICVYNWGNSKCYLPEGSTSATLRNDKCDIDLIPGDVIIFEVYHNSNRVFDLAHTNDIIKEENLKWAHPVRINSVSYAFDNFYDPPVPIINVTWNEDDKLPFSIQIPDEDVYRLCNRSKQDSLCDILDEDKYSAQNIVPSSQDEILLVRGNVILVRHGYTIKEEKIGSPYSFRDVNYYPSLSKKPLSFSKFVNLAKSSAYLLKNSFEYFPLISIKEGSIRKEDDILQSSVFSKYLDVVRMWNPVLDLLKCNEDDPCFVAEVDDNMTVFLRFGDGTYGMRPSQDGGESSNEFYATYCVGSGIAGNIGKYKIRSIVQSEKFDFTSISKIYNPLEAEGGIEPQNIEEARLLEPEKIGSSRYLDRAVTENDYILITEKNPEVQKALAFFKWTGSWYTLVIAIDRHDNKIVDAEFKEKIKKYLQSFKLSCTDIEIEPPIFVPLFINLNVCLEQNVIKSHILQRLYSEFSSGTLIDGRRGFFHPDNYSFSQPVYLSRIYERVLSINGIISVTALNFEKMEMGPERELEQGLISVDKNEIIRVDNDPRFPEYGSIQFKLSGGI